MQPLVRYHSPPLGSYDTYSSNVAYAQGFFFSISCVQLNWRSSIREFSQIWLQTRYESRKKTGSFYILGYLLELSIKIWRSGIFCFLKSGELGPFFPWKILYRLKSYFSCQNLTKFPPPSHLPPFKKTQPMHSSSGKLCCFLQRNSFVAKMTIFHRKMQKS